MAVTGPGGGLYAIVIFGAAVRADGRASPSLARRTGYAAHAARIHPAAPVFCSGAPGRAPRSEASVMAELLDGHGIERGRLVLDEASEDTLQSVVAAARFVRGQGLAGCLVCTDTYHVPRVRMMLRALGVPSAPGPLAAGRAGTRRRDWWRMHLREAAAYPYDWAVIRIRRRELLALIAAEP